MTDRIDFGGKPWTAIPREVLRDPALSPQAKGGLVTLLSHEEGWVRSVIAVLMRESRRCGRKQARAIMRELQDAGYAQMTQERGEGGRFTTGYTVFAQKQETGVEHATSPGAPPRGAVSRGALPGSTVVEEALDVDPLDEDTLKKNQELASTSSTRMPDLIFEALFSLETGKVYSSESAKILTPAARGTLNRAVADIKSTEIGLHDLVRAMGAWSIVMGEATCTASAVAKHLPRLLAAADGNVARGRQPSDSERTMADLARYRQEREQA